MNLKHQLMSVITSCRNDLHFTACVDRHQNCTLWATEGDCEQFPNWMLDKCPVSCQFCSPKETEQVPLTNIRTGAVLTFIQHSVALILSLYFFLPVYYPTVGYTAF